MLPPLLDRHLVKFHLLSLNLKIEPYENLPEIAARVVLLLPDVYVDQLCHHTQTCQ
jgi:hypothetical protein